jgi:chlorobactene glucosyltransferase
MSAASWLLPGAAGLASLALGPMSAVMAWNLLRAPRLERARGPSRRVSASVLVPARDEERNLGDLLTLLLAETWEDLEILVLDDGSRDGTAAIAAAAAAAHGPRVRLLAGEPLPPGWLGKSWACAQLAEAARGEVLIFCDADARPQPGAVAATLGLMEELGADALACLPRQELGSWGEKALVPLVLHLPVIGMLPLPLVHRRPEPSLSLGVGQWFAFDRGAYLRCGGHAAVRAALAEDMALARRLKLAGCVAAAALSTRLVSVRMYRGFAEAWEGFGKNLVVLTGSGWLRPAAVLAFFLLAYVAPWAMAAAVPAGLASPAWILPAALLLGQRLAVAATFREPAWAWLWHAPGSLLLAALALRSRAGFRKGSLRWKGRVLTAAMPDHEAAADVAAAMATTTAAAAMSGYQASAAVATTIPAQPPVPAMAREAREIPDGPEERR